MARDIHYAESLGEDTTTSGTYQDKVTLTFTPQASTDYILLWSAEVICQDTSTDVFARLYNSTDAVQYSEQNLENRTTSGTPYRIVHGIAKYTGSGSPSSTSFKLQWYSESGTNALIRKASVLAISMESDDEYAESLSDQTTTSNTYVDGVSLTFTPASQGDYMIFASCDWNHGSTSDVIWLKLLDSSSSDVSEMKTHNRDATNYNPYTTFIKQNLTAASKTFKLQVHRSSANTITLRNQRIFAMRMDNGFDNVYYAEDRTGGTTTSTSYQDKNSLTQTTNAADHIIINMSGFTSSSTTISTNEQFLEDGSVIRGPLEARSNSSGGNNFYYPVFRVRHATLTGASHTWKNQYQSGGIGNTAGIDELATAVLEYTVVSGTTYNDTITAGTITLGDSEAAAATFNATRSESITVTDSEAVAGTFVTTTSDAITLTDSMAGGLVLTGEFSAEGIAVDDSIAVVATLEPSLSEALTVTDSNAVTAVMNRDYSEAVTVADSNAVLVTVEGSLSEAVTLDDSVSGGLLLSSDVTETLTLDDSQSVAATFRPTLSESVTVDDSNTVSMSFSLFVSEGVTTGYTNAVVLSVDASLQEDITPSDNISGGLIITGSFSEDITLSDSRTVIAEINAALNDTISVDDSHAASADFVAANSESIVLGESYADSLTGGVASDSDWIIRHRRRG